MRKSIAFLACFIILGAALPVWAEPPEATPAPEMGAPKPGTSTPTVGEERREEKKAASATRVAEVERGGALLPKWRMVIEPFFEYNHISSQNVSLSGFSVFEAILIGQVSVQKLKRDLYIPGVTLRLGLQNAELNVRIPWLFRTDKMIFPRSGGGTGDLIEKSFSGSGLGDIDSYVYYHLVKEGKWKPWVPDIIIRLGGKFPTGTDPYNLNREFIQDLGSTVATEFPTGTGHWGTSIGVNIVKSADPAVLFFNCAYYYNFGRTVGLAGDPPTDFGKIKLGNSFEYSIGLIIALQEKLSMNFSFNQRLTGRTTQNGVYLTDTSINAIAFNIGATYVISPRTAMDFVVGIGLSPDAPNVSVLVRMPWSFQL
jgi:hypothetical protein